MKKTYNQPQVEVSAFTAEAITTNVNSDNMSERLDDWEN